MKSREKIDNTDLNNLLQKAIEAKPEFVEPPPLVAIGHPRLGYKPKSFESDPYKKFNIVLLLILSICMIGLGIAIGLVL